MDPELDATSHRAPIKPGENRADTDSFSKYQSLGDKVLALESELAEKSRQYADIHRICDQQRADLKSARQEIEILGAKLANLAGTEAVRRKDISLEQFFRHAAKRSCSASTRNGFLTLGGQVLHGGATALPSTWQLTIDALQANNAPSPSKDSVEASRVPRPRFWGNPQINEYGLEHLRASIAEMGLDAATSPEFPKTKQEIADAAAGAELKKYRQGVDGFWNLAKAIAAEVQHIPTTATRDEVLLAFQKIVPGKVPGESCIVYSVESDFVSKLKEISFWSNRKKERVVLPAGTGLASAVLEERKSMIVVDLQNHKSRSRELEALLGYPRESALASPCFNSRAQVEFILEVTCSTKRVHYTQHDRMLLEFAGMLLLPLILRTRVAEELVEAVRIQNLVFDSAKVMSSMEYIDTINNIARNCSDCINGRVSRVWIVDKGSSSIFVNTDDESKAEIIAIGSGTGPLGAAVHSKVSSILFTDGYGDEEAVSFACVPIVDRNDKVLGVLELGQKHSKVTGCCVRFSDVDKEMMHAFAVLLANFIEHSQFVFTLRKTCGGMQAQLGSWMSFDPSTRSGDADGDGEVEN